MLLFPKRRPDLVDEEGGGGFWICDAVGARDWRIEYVRCIVNSSCEQDFGKSIDERVRTLWIVQRGQQSLSKKNVVWYN